MVDFLGFYNTPKINQFIKETFLSETFFHFSSMKTFWFDVFLVTKTWFIIYTLPIAMMLFSVSLPLQNRSVLTWRRRPLFSFMAIMPSLFLYLYFLCSRKKFLVFALRTWGQTFACIWTGVFSTAVLLFDWLAMVV